LSFSEWLYGRWISREQKTIGIGARYPPLY
jgi:hypothetical protein